ncbi:CHRNA9 [Branchiostoma lanceolatum]|uniref:CHRNA9 protein n=1 Tax=Branchiostoma lanceolatum TaxID=7740 RepID=A0A8J9YSL4_BRALA|nr:CHRNA9 [Branchiostoma lanceolatum]
MCDQRRAMSLPRLLQLSVIFMCCIWKGCLGSDASAKLRESLLATYDRARRPVKNVDHNVSVAFQVALRQISDLDEKNQVLQTFTWVRVYWRDEFLSWNASEYGGVDELQFSPSELWIPDIYLYNNVDAGSDGGLHAKTNIIVTPSGDVKWLAPIAYTSSCRIDIRLFPYDDQNCSMIFGSWTHTGIQVDLYPKGDTGDLSSYADNGEFELMGMPVERRVVYYPCCPEPYPNLHVTISLRRRTMFYFFNLLLPGLVLEVINPLVFFLPPDSGERIGFCMTILLALVVFLQIVSASMPPTSEAIPLIGEFYAASIFILGVTALLNILTLHVYYHGAGQKPMSNFIRKTFLKWTARILGMGDLSQPDCPVGSSECHHYYGPVPTGKSGNRTSCDNDTDMNCRMPDSPRAGQDLLKAVMETKTERSSKMFGQHLGEILRSVKFLIGDFQDRKTTGNRESEWKTLGLVLDRFLMFFTIFYTIVVNVLLLLPALNL